MFNESLLLNFTGNMYEPLIGRGKKLELIPQLATEWKQTAPTVWRFKLRKGVKFQDGTPFTADDVIFSYERAKGEGSDMKTYVGQMKEIRKIDTYTVDIVTNEPFPILPEIISVWYMMSKSWCEKNNADAAGGYPQGHRELRQHARERYRSLHAQVAPTRRAHGAGTQSRLVGQAGAQPHRGDIPAHRQRSHARRGAHFRRDRHDGAGAAAGRAAPAGRPQVEGAARPRAAHDLPRHGSETRRAAVLQREGQEPVQGSSACDRPSIRPSTSRPSARASCAARPRRPP